MKMFFLARPLLALSLLAMPALAAADGYVMGSGRWTCADAIAAWNGEPIDKGQFVGWVLGYWSAATFEREDSFVDIVENVGGEAILSSTLTECQAHPDEQLFVVVRSMIGNTQ